MKEMAAFFILCTLVPARATNWHVTLSGKFRSHTAKEAPLCLSAPPSAFRLVDPSVSTSAKALQRLNGNVLFLLALVSQREKKKRLQ